MDLLWAIPSAIYLLLSSSKLYLVENLVSGSMLDDKRLSFITCHLFWQGTLYFDRMSPDVLDTIRPELEVMCFFFFQSTWDVFIITKCNIDVDDFSRSKLLCFCKEPFLITRCITELDLEDSLSICSLKVFWSKFLIV